MSNRPPKAYDAVPFTNSRGDVLQPGDAAVAVTTSTGRSGFVFGKYLGVRNGGVVMYVQRDRQKFVNERDEEYDFNAEYKEIPYSYGDYYKYRYGTPEYTEAYQRYQDERNEAEIKRTKRREGYAYKNFPYWGYTTLQNNNVYPGDIALRDVTL